MVDPIPSHVDPDGSPPVDFERLEVGTRYELTRPDGTTVTVEVTDKGRNETSDGTPGAKIVAYQKVV